MRSQFDLNVGGAIPINKDALSTGINLSLEGKVNDERFAIGLRAAMTMSKNDVVGGFSAHNQNSSIKNTFSLLFVTDFYFLKSKKVAPFIGGGYGAYYLPSILAYSYNNFTGEKELGESAKQLNWGGMLRTGIEYNRTFRFTCEYNFAGKNGNRSYDYISANIGIMF